MGELVESGSSAITALGVYYLVMILLSLTGLVILCAEGGRLEFCPAERELFKGTRFKTAFLNPGVICFAVLMIFLIVNGYAGFLEF